MTERIPRPEQQSNQRPSLGQRAALRLRDWMRTTSNGPLRFVWTAVYAALRQGVTLTLRIAAPGSTIVARGTFGEGRPLFGYSDLDLVAVADNPAKALALRHAADQVNRRLPVLRQAIDVAVTTRAELQQVATTPYACLRKSPTGHKGTSLPRGLGIGFVGRARPWRHLAGPRLASLQPIPPHLRLHWCWTETQFRWKHLLRALLGPSDRLQAAHVASSALVGLAQAKAWAETGDEPVDTEQALREAIQLAPDCAAVIEAALQHRRGRLPPEPRAVLPAIAALTHAVVRRMDAAAAGTGAAVRLVGAGDGSARAEKPLLDWRSMVLPTDAHETVSTRRGSITDLSLLQSSAARDGRRRRAIVDGRVLLLPIQPGSPADAISSQSWVLRSVLCEVSDPVCWALVQNHSTANFTELPGWSLRDWTARSAADLSGQLNEQAFRATDRRGQFARLVAASRLLALEQSMADGSPELLVGLEAVLDWAAGAGLPTAGIGSEAGDASLDRWRRALAAELTV